MKILEERNLYLPMDSLDNLRRFLNRCDMAAAPFFTAFPTDFTTFLTARVDFEVPEGRDDEEGIAE